MEYPFVFGEAAFGEGMIIGGGQPFHFKAVLRPQTPEERDRLDESMIHQVIGQVKPALCTYTLEIIMSQNLP
ncbi:MAG: hypothetical protein F6K09_29820 [Merismopedia sp. SIO2A8]|nr:hypothetical protein [Merismopedia sp. SIO2A8]